jgi:hypothetical protein
MKSYFCKTKILIMKKIFCFWRLLFCQIQQAQQRPKLVVGIVVDQG